MCYKKPCQPISKRSTEADAHNNAHIGFNWPFLCSRRSVAVRLTLFHAFGLGAPLRVRPIPHGPVWHPIYPSVATGKNY